MTHQSDRPVQRFKAGSVSAAVWATTRERGGRTSTRYAVSIVKRYKDPEGNWHNGTTFFPNDLPRVQLVAGKAYEFCSTGGKDPGTD